MLLNSFGTIRFIKYCITHWPHSDVNISPLFWMKWLWNESLLPYAAGQYHYFLLQDKYDYQRSKCCLHISTSLSSVTSVHIISVIILCFHMLCCKFIPLERAVGDGERMFDLLQRWGQHRLEVRFFLRHNRAPSRELGKCLFTPATQSRIAL